MSTKLLIWYGISSLVFGIVLFYPTRKFIYAMAVNRATAKARRQLSEQELSRLKKKVNITAAFISITFAFVYNRFLIFKFWGG